MIADAGTGRTPFAADMPHMVAVRILTMPPCKDSTFTHGRVVLGVLKTSSGQSPVRVSFNDVEIRA